jgi:hypothetical protein
MIQIIEELKSQVCSKNSCRENAARWYPVTTKTVDAIQEDSRQNKGYGLFFPDEPWI